MYSIPKSAFERTLSELGKSFDENENMIVTEFSSPGYHTALKGGMVHRTRESLNYAVALLDSGDEKNFQRAVKILRKVISLQDTNPENETYGIWSWFLEEPLEQMSRPDWNWADFCGKQLLQVALDHSERLDDELRQQVINAVIHACNAIIKRNVGPGYTNISIMGTYVTHVAGELFGNEDILNYARKRLKELHEYNIRNSEFSEYNSPTYTVVAIEEIASMLLHIKDKNSLKMIEDLNEIAWGCLARHFHAPTGQWAGPHSRCYRNILPSKVTSLIQVATAGEVVLMKEDELCIDPSWVRMNLACPEKFQPYFTAVYSDRVEKKIYRKADDNGPAEMENCYFSNSFVLSSFYQANLWNQRRPLLAYFGTADKPGYMQLRCLHDGYDYCSAHLQCVQEKGQVLGIVNFVTDGGDTHITLNTIKDGTIMAGDLRVRLEFGGPAKLKGVEKIGDKSFRVHLEGLTLNFEVIDAALGGNEIRYEAGGSDGTTWIDIILYQGDKKEINFIKTEKAYVAFVLEMTQESGKGFKASAFCDEDKIKLEMNASKILAIETPKGPVPLKELLSESKGSIDGAPYVQTCK